MPITVRNNGQLWISVGHNRKSKSWKNQHIPWAELVEKLQKAVKTSETYAEYISFDKPTQAEKKDVGGFVGGAINGGRRLANKVSSRHLITLDVDFATGEFWDDFKLLYGNAAVMYSTHKHCEEAPRYRLVMPLSREVFADEYQAIARQIAGVMGIDLFDSTTFQAERLMYWPSVSKDKELYYRFQDGPFIDADAVLSTYKNWTDSSQWPVSTLAKASVVRAAEKQGDPLEKPGPIGAFNRVYTIPEAIEAYLKDIYVPTDDPGRYTYTGGSTAAGLILYEDKFAYSHHGTDPISGRLCSAFDLVRIHLYGDLDENALPDTPINRRPSHLAMAEKAVGDKEVSKELSLVRLKEAGFDFTDIEDAEMDWVKDLNKDGKGNVLPTIFNVVLVLRNDPYLKGCFASNKFENMHVALKDLPWRTIKRTGEFLIDDDDACLRSYIEKNYSIYNIAKIDDAFSQLMTETAFHPVKDFLNSLTWDNKPRIDSLLIDYFGAEDTPYTRMVTRKSLVAAVGRIYLPGCKFDNVLTLVGRQGCGKSTFIGRLGRSWYSDSFGDLNKKESVEQIQGVWLMEIGELSGFRKADIETVKHFVAKREDRFRVAYGRRIAHFPRQCVFIATTNKSDYLIDETGNRRFWTVQLYITEPEKNVFTDMTPGEVNQIWAEAVTMYQGGETLHLSAEVEAMAEKVQAKHMEKDPREDMINAYLELEIPVDWYDYTIYQKRDYINDKEQQETKETMPRAKITPLEVYLELLGGIIKDASYHNLKPIRAVLRRNPKWEERVVKVGKEAQRGFYRKV